MRLRQVAFVAKDLEPVRQDLEHVFGLNVAYRDPGVAAYGLINVVMPFGGDFLEVVQPVTAEASAGRYLARRGGDAGYMLIFQAPDAVRHRQRLMKLGLRNIAELNTPAYTFTHFHPADVNGVLTSIDTEGDGTSWNEPDGPWTPAGPDWEAARAGSEIVGILGARVLAPDPQAAAKRWAELFEGKAQGAKTVIDGGTIAFVKAADPRASGIVGLDVAVKNPSDHLARGRNHGLRVEGDAVWICGTAVHLHAG